MSDITRLFNNRVPTKTEVRKSVREKKNFNVKLLLKDNKKLCQEEIDKYLDELSNDKEKYKKYLINLKK